MQLILDIHNKWQRRQITLSQSGKSSEDLAGRLGPYPLSDFCVIGDRISRRQEINKLTDKMKQWSKKKQNMSSGYFSAKEKI